MLIDIPESKDTAGASVSALRGCIEDIGIRGGAVQNAAGGGISMRDVRIYSVEGGTALTVINDSGGSIEANIHDNPGAIGFELRNCHRMKVDLTSRNNAVGGRISDSGSLCGRLYCEHNAGFGIELDELCQSNICLWLEANNKNVLQGRRRLCWGNVFSGMTQSDSNGAWDDDRLSQAGNDETSSPTHLADLGNILAIATPTRTIFPTGVVTSGDSVTIRAGAFAGYRRTNGQPNWIEARTSREARLRWDLAVGRFLHRLHNDHPG